MLLTSLLNSAETPRHPPMMLKASFPGKIQNEILAKLFPFLADLLFFLNIFKFSVGVDADEERLNKVLSELSGKNVEEVIAEGKEKLASVPSGKRSQGQICHKTFFPNSRLTGQFSVDHPSKDNWRILSDLQYLFC